MLCVWRTTQEDVVLLLFDIVAWGWGWSFVQIEAVAAAAHAARHTCGRTAGCCWVWWDGLTWKAAGRVGVYGASATMWPIEKAGRAALPVKSSSLFLTVQHRRQQCW